MKSLPQASHKICTTRPFRCHNTSSSRKARNINFYIHYEHQHNIRVAQEGEFCLVEPAGSVIIEAVPYDSYSRSQGSINFRQNHEDAKQMFVTVLHHGT